MNEIARAATDISSLRRHGVVFALFILSMITYVDRTSISTAKSSMATELNLSDSAMGMAFSAFALGYAFTQIPAGWLADRCGPKTILASTVGLWSLLTALTGAVWSLPSLLAIRFFFGASEAAVFPGSVRAIRNWLPTEQRGRANGVLFAGSRIGAALSYPLLVWMLTLGNWRNVFVVLGIVSLIWAVSWMIWLPDLPLQNQSSQQKSFISGSNEITFPAQPITISVGLAMAQYFASNFTNFICLSWMYPYLKVQYHLSSSHAAFYSMAPLLLGATSQGIAGSVVDRMYSSTLRNWSRRLPAVIGFALAVVGLFAVTQARSVGLTVLSFMIAIFGADLTISPSWVFCTDIAGEYTGSISGAMNMAGGIGAFASANAFPFLNRMTGNSSTYFFLAIGLNVMGIVCWTRMRSVQPSSLHTLRPLGGAE
jgi:MFS transporter, ACS family, glucarate transporter